MKTGVELIAIEREDQLTKHKRSIKSDVRWNKNGELADVARALIEFIEQSKDNEEEMIAGMPASWGYATCNR
jgi:hypothetical protein